MNKYLIGGIAVAAILSTTAIGYRIGAGHWPEHAAMQAKTLETSSAPSTARKVLYWKDPDAGNDFSPAPKKAADGRDYVPVYDDQEPNFTAATPTPVAPAKGGPRKLLYYRNPMGLADTSPVPKKDWMGMDYIPVYEGEEQDANVVKVSLDKVQRTGVRTAPVEMRRINRLVRAPGVAKPDERTLLSITLRADGFIEKLYVNETGQHVKAGDPLFRLYSPEMVRVQVDYRNFTTTVGIRDERGAIQRLKNLALPDSVIDELVNSRKPILSFDWPAPASGVVMQKKVVEGMMMKAGEELFRIADLSSIWVIADVPEQDIAMVKVGATARLSFRAFPGETFTGRVTFILHELEMATRTAKVRIEVKNPHHRLRHEMFADVEIDAGNGKGEQLVVPDSAVIDSGNRQVVLVEKGEGRYEPRSVKLGTRGDGYVEIAEGVKSGEQVVVAANFLIDAESNLKAALQGFTAPSQTMPEVKP
jgi:Cu(I)/Ag(I) efflux system membrane fusion protein